jgi:hypothetical protein
MNTGGWILLMVSWGIILTVLAYCLVLTLKRKDMD